jgi:hypothetical protein
MILQDQTNIAHLKTPTKKEIESDFQPRRNPECQRDLVRDMFRLTQMRHPERALII